MMISKEILSPNSPNLQLVPINDLERHITNSDFLYMMHIRSDVHCTHICIVAGLWMCSWRPHENTQKVRLSPILATIPVHSLVLLWWRMSCVRIFWMWWRKTLKNMTFQYSRSCKHIFWLVCLNEVSISMISSTMYDHCRTSRSVHDMSHHDIDEQRYLSLSHLIAVVMAIPQLYLLAPHKHVWKNRRNETNVW